MKLCKDCYKRYLFLFLNKRMEWSKLIELAPNPCIYAVVDLKVVEGRVWG